MATPYGMPIWYELLVPDTAAAKTFYTAVVGWNAVDLPTPEGVPPYTAFAVGDAGVGGLMTLPADAPTGPGWLFYLHVADVDASVARAQAAGATVYMPGFDLPNVGRIAFLADPGGVPFYLMTPAATLDDRASVSFGRDTLGSCSWNELATEDHKATMAFFADLLGWDGKDVMPMGEHGDYSFIDVAGTQIGAMMDRMAEQPKGWRFYFRVADVAAAAETVKAQGGQVFMGPMEVPGGERVILCADNQGASVGFVSGAESK